MFNLLHKWPLMNNGPTSGAGGAAAAGAKQNHAQVEKNEVEVSGNGNVGLGVSSNHILQFPRQPQRNDGRWVALGSLIGALLGRLASGSMIEKAKKAEDKWKDANDKLFTMGNDQFSKAPGQWDGMLKADAEVEQDADWNLGARDIEQAYAYKLDNCNDALHDKLCQYVQCGYKPDYYGIAARVVAAAEAATAKECREIKRQLNRYSVDRCCDISVKLATAKVMAVVGAVSKQREDERRKQWEINSELIFKGTDLMEKHRQGRLNDAQNFDKSNADLRKFLYQQRQSNYHTLVKSGGEFLAAAGKNYGWLSDSYRKTAEKDQDMLANLGAMIAVVAAMFLFDKSEDSCGGGSAKAKGFDAAAADVARG